MKPKIQKARQDLALEIWNKMDRKERFAFLDKIQGDPDIVAWAESQ